MVDKILITFALSEFLFVTGGALLIGFAVVTQNQSSQSPSIENVARILLLNRCPLTAAIVNAVFIFVTFLFAMPALMMPMTRGWLKVHGYMVTICGLFTLILGLTVWYDTLRMRNNLMSVWGSQPTSVQSMLQQELGCCGYMNSTAPFFVTDPTCTSAVVAAQKGSCVGPFSNFANNYLDVIFTAAFGIVGIDVALIIAIAMLVKDRKEKARYRHIDEKNNPGTF